MFRSELNPVDFLHRAAYMYPDKVAVVHGKRRYSYRKLAERSWRLANALRSAGLAKGTASPRWRHRPGCPACPAWP
jgi:fatty-acyl-CoA synthase